MNCFSRVSRDFVRSMQTQHSATSGRYDSVVLIGMVKADDCIKANDKLKKHGITNTIVGEVLKYWHANARDSAKIMKFYKDETKLEYQPLGIYKSEIPGNVMIGIAQNLQPQYRKRMEQEISTDYYQENKVEVNAPELASLLEASMGSPRIHFYPAGTGAMGAHYNSCNNHYDDIRQQKYSILFDMRTSSETSLYRRPAFKNERRFHFKQAVGTINDSFVLDYNIFDGMA